METTQTVGTQGGRAEAALEAACLRFTQAFNRFDPKEVAACWTEDGTLISPAGELGRGRAGVETTYRHDCESILAGTTSRFTITSVRWLGPDLAFLDLDHDLENCMRPDGTRGPMKIHVAMLARQEGGDWRWLDVRPYAFVPRPPQVH